MDMNSNTKPTLDVYYISRQTKWLLDTTIGIGFHTLLIGEGTT